MTESTPKPDELRGYLMQVGHSLNLVCELPEWLEHAPLAKHLRHAVAEFAEAIRDRRSGELMSAYTEHTGVSPHGLRPSPTETTLGTSSPLSAV